MQWVDQETYVGVCRRVTQRPYLMQRRRRNRAQPAPPDPRTLFSQVAFAYRLGEGALATDHARLRLEAGIDLANRLGDRRMSQAFQSLSAALSTTAQPN